MEKKVTKEEVERVLEQYLTPITKEPILNELFPPEFKVGDKVVVESGGMGALFADGVVGNIINKPKEKPIYYGGQLWKVDAKVYVESFDGKCYGLCNGYKLRHATPEEIAAAEWKPNKPYKVWIDNDVEEVRISADKVGYFYSCATFEGDVHEWKNYEKL